MLFMSEERRHQIITVVGGEVRCASRIGKDSKKCHRLAEAYCNCGIFLCSLHLASHKCILRLRARYDDDILAALA